MHTHQIKGHFPGKSKLAGCPLDSERPLHFILSIFRGQAETLHIICMVVWVVPCMRTFQGLWSRWTFSRAWCPSCCSANGIKALKTKRMRLNRK